MAPPPRRRRQRPCGSARTIRRRRASAPTCRWTSYVIVLTPPPVHEPTRLRFQLEAYGAQEATGVAERTLEASGRYAAAAQRAGAELVGGGNAVDLRGAFWRSGRTPGPPWWARGSSRGAAGCTSRPVGRPLWRSSSPRPWNAWQGKDLRLRLPTELPLGSAIGPLHFNASMGAHQSAARAAAGPSARGKRPPPAGAGGAKRRGAAAVGGVGCLVRPGRMLRGGGRFSAH